VGRGHEEYHDYIKEPDKTLTDKDIGEQSSRQTKQNDEDVSDSQIHLGKLISKGLLLV
jgi:hypothetical protein